MRALINNRSIALLLVLVSMIIILAILNPTILSLKNLLEITQFGAPLALLTIGQSLVLLLGNEGIDLSVGSSLSLTGVIFGLLVVNGMNFWLSVLITLVLGLVLGLINGLLVSMLKFPPMITTLGTMYAYGSLALYINRGIPISGFPQGFSVLSQGNTFGVPNQILFIVIPIFIFTYYFVHKTATGRKLYLTGTNDLAAKLATISTDKLRLLAYTYAGFLASIAGIIMCSWLMTAKADAGNGMEMQAITAAVLGGFSISGGIGSVPAIAVSVLIITLLTSGLQIANINAIWELGILGVLLIVIVVLDERNKRK